ncbi:hypothetical protein EGW08_011835 [Elysia chlorotica]|uniref:Uncharacterized protein n=1 Tax=Elysia chlorotica TaxID=188477 RepID=A0A3S0ZLB4_ELYCH|nr:hypothetical protein EGW08_011835 [Elysia chlorotica]
MNKMAAVSADNGPGSEDCRNDWGKTCSTDSTNITAINLLQYVCKEKQAQTEKKKNRSRRSSCRNPKGDFSSVVMPLEEVVIREIGAHQSQPEIVRPVGDRLACVRNGAAPARPEMVRTQSAIVGCRGDHLAGIVGGTTGTQRTQRRIQSVLYEHSEPISSREGLTMRAGPTQEVAMKGKKQRRREGEGQKAEKRQSQGKEMHK